MRHVVINGTTLAEKICPTAEAAEAKAEEWKRAGQTATILTEDEYDLFLAALIADPLKDAKQ